MIDSGNVIDCVECWEDLNWISVGKYATNQRLRYGAALYFADKGGYGLGKLSLCVADHSRKISNSLFVTGVLLKIFARNYSIQRMATAYGGSDFVVPATNSARNKTCDSSVITSPASAINYPPVAIKRAV